MIRNSIKLFKIRNGNVAFFRNVSNISKSDARNTVAFGYKFPAPTKMNYSSDFLSIVKKAYFHHNLRMCSEEEKSEEEKKQCHDDPVFQYLLYSSIAAVILLLSYQFIHHKKMKRKIEKANMLKTIQKIRESGILASDENEVIMEDRFTKIGVENTEENRREYREVLYNSPGIERYVSGAILCRETFDQKTKGGIRFVDLLNKKGIEVGLCVDDGWVVNQETGESLTRGMKDIHKECKHAKDNGASFVKWRTVFHMDKEGKSPSSENMFQNVQDIIKYVRTAQSYGLVPIVEPEVSVFATDELTLDQVTKTTTAVLSHVFRSLEDPSNKTDVSRIILKPNMVVCKEYLDHPHVVGEMTIHAFQEAKVPRGMAIMFLSGGMNEKQSKDNLNQIARRNQRLHNKWRFSYSFGRALQESCRNSWRGKKENTEEARNAFLKQARDCYYASYGMMFEQ